MIIAISWCPKCPVRNVLSATGGSYVLGLIYHTANYFFHSNSILSDWQKTKESNKIWFNFFKWYSSQSFWFKHLLTFLLISLVLSATAVFSVKYSFFAKLLQLKVICYWSTRQPLTESAKNVSLYIHPLEIHTFEISECPVRNDQNTVECPI